MWTPCLHLSLETLSLFLTSVSKRWHKGHIWLCIPSRADFSLRPVRWPVTKLFRGNVCEDGHDANLVDVVTSVENSDGERKFWMYVWAASDPPSFLSSPFLKSFKREEGLFIYFPMIHKILDEGSCSEIQCRILRSLKALVWSPFPSSFLDTLLHWTTFCFLVPLIL